MAMKKFYVGIKGVITDGENVLLVRGDRPGRDFWDTPGGRIDDDEDVLQALDRELHEELPNIAAYTVGELLHVERVHRDVEGDVSLVLVFYRVTGVTFDGPPQVSEEHTESAWMPLERAIAEGKPTITAALRRAAGR